MNAHEYLSQIKDFDITITNLQDEIDALYKQASGLSSPAFGERVQTSTSGDSPQEKILLKLEKHILTYTNLKNRYLRLRKKIVDQIDNLDDWRYKRILYLTYIKGWHTAEIADEMNYVPETVRRMRAEAREMFQKKYLVTECYT